MASSPSFPTADESEVVDALLLLSKPEPSVWGSKKRRSVHHKSKSDSIISAKDEFENKIVPRSPSPKSPLCLNRIVNDPQPSSSGKPPSSDVPPSEMMPPRSTSAKWNGMLLKEQKERVAELVRDNLTLRKIRFQTKTDYLILKELNASLKRIKEGLILNWQSRSQIPVGGNVAVVEETNRSSQLLTAAETREGCAAARKRRRELMRAKAGEKCQRLR